MENARNELEEYYWNELPPIYNETLEYIETKSGGLYEEADWCHNKGEYKEYVFTLSIDKKYTGRY